MTIRTGRTHAGRAASGREGGDILVTVIVFAAMAVTATLGLVNWGAAILSGIRTAATKEQAFQIAEAGADYYRWHLAQYPNDYTDGTDEPGPYYHTFADKNGAIIGSYALTVTPPPVGSTKVVITSTATTTANPNIVKTIQVTLAEPSLAQYAVIANDFLRFGQGTVVYGPISSNVGIHFDGVAYNLVSSALTTTTDPDVSCWPYPACAVEWGVFTQSGKSDPQPPTPAYSRPDVFVAGRKYPTPSYPFASLAVSLSDLLSIAAPNGVCSSPSCWAPSGSKGYYMHMNANGTYDMYKVTAVQSPPRNCSNDAQQAQWGTWSVRSQTKIGTYPIPSSGVIFVKDDLWIDGQVNGTRVTIAAADIGQTNTAYYKNITVNHSLTYANSDGSDVIGLIAQNNVNVGLYSDDVLEIDAALVAENGRVGRFYYNEYCRTSSVPYYARSSITLNGMIATAIRYGFAYTGSNPYCSDVSSGYCDRNLSYDGNLLYSPPPSFPLQQPEQYQTVSWKQLQ